jgi:hypothetical protein
MNEDRTRILGMLAEGKLSTDEADLLLDALETPAATTATTTMSPAVAGAVDAADKILSAPGAPKYLFVTVDGNDKVNVKVPLGLLRAGLKLTSLIPPVAMDEINKSMAESGVAMFFSSNRFPGSQHEFQWRREDLGGHPDETFLLDWQKNLAPSLEMISPSKKSTR